MAIDVTFFRQGTTPLLEITAIGEQIADATVYVTIEQRERHITKTNYDDDPSVTMEISGSDTKIEAVFSQEETLFLRPGSARVQLRWITEDGTAGASDMGYVEIGETLLKGVIEYG